MSVVSVNDIMICFKTGDIKDIGLKEFLAKKIKGTFHIQELWAVNGISFTLEQGDMLGIIGKNGAGKSTLLKAISGVYEPTGGSVKTEGSIAALLELTAGFDGELTVSENIFLRGALLGYTRSFICQMYDEILTFAELKGFEERQFKQLSSGMRSRLAFSIACLVNPDILILDEVLSVGDGAFREKSEKKMREILSRGVTSLFVSHSVSQVRRLCNKILWMDKGRQITFSNDVQKICDCYEEYLVTNELPVTAEDYDRLAHSWRLRQKEKEKEELEMKKQKILSELEGRGSAAAFEASMEVIRKQRPDLANVISENL